VDSDKSFRFRNQKGSSELLDLRSEPNYNADAVRGVACGGISGADSNQKSTVSRKRLLLAPLRLSGFNRRVFLTANHPKNEILNSFFCIAQCLNSTLHKRRK
jgi:hypothetical protein